MGTSNFGGTSSATARTDQHVASSGIGFPTGRTAANGKGPIVITALRGYASGLGATRIATMYLGPVKTGSFSIAAAGSANSTGFRSVSNGLIANGGSGTFTMVFNGMSWFAHGGGGSTVDSYGTVLSGNLGGDFNYNEVPSAPQSPSVSATGGGALVIWSAPSSNGGASINGYTVQYATNSGFTTGKGSMSVGAVLSAHVTGLTPGTTYWFRVYAKNAVTAAAGTTSVASSSVNVAVGDWFASGAHSYKATITSIGTAPNYISLALQHTIAVSGLDLTQVYSAAVSINFVPSGGAHKKALLVQPEFDWLDGSSNVISSVVGNPLNIMTGSSVVTFPSMTIPGGAVTGRINIMFPSLNSSGTANFVLNDVVYADAAMLVNGSVVAYFDGNSGGTTAWTGTANNSTSTMTLAPTVVFYDAYQDNNIIYSVNVGEVSTTAVQTTNFATQLFQPTVTDAAVPTIGTYAILDTNGLRVPAATWAASGASVTGTIDPVTPGLINLNFIGPKYTIQGFTAPFSFAVVIDANNTKATLTLLGSGVVTNPTTINLLTGANPDTTPADVTSTFDSPFITDIGTLYDAGVWAAVAAAGPVLSITFQVATETLDGFGLTTGAIVSYQNANWRITEVQIGYNTTTITASWYTTMNDVDTAWSGQLLGAKDIVWQGYEFADQLIEPLRIS